MTHDPPCPLETMLARFGAYLKAAGRRVLLARDGLDYINPDANNGANEPAEEDGHGVLLARDGLDYINPDANNGANEPAEEDGHA